MMRPLFTKALLFVVLCAAHGASMATPIMYSFSTGVTSGAFPGLAELFNSSATVSGGFRYDSAADYSTTVTGLDLYGAFSPSSSLTPSFTNLSGTVDGHTFSDPQGVALVANDNFNPGSGMLVDFFSLNADPSLSSSSTRNISGFSINDYTLWRVRLFWIEGFETPGLIPDFVSGAGLLSAPPSFNGRLALDFVDVSGADAGSVFFDGLTVAATPEPATLALLGLGLAGLGWSRRKKA